MKTAKVMVLGALALVGAKLPAAESVWPEGLGNEKNVTVEFAGEFDYVAGDVKLVFSAASIARVKVNGEFAAYGPARPPLGYERQDEWNLTKFAKPGRNVIAIEVAGYNIGSFYLMKIPPYLKASVEVGGRTVLSTAVRPGPGVFTARRRLDRIQKVTRYCYQRPFAEAWRLPEERSGELRLSQTADYPTLSRRVPYPKFKVVPVAPVRRETLVRKETNYVDRAITSVGKEPNFEGFREGEYEVDLLGERQRYAITGATPLRAEDPRTLTPGTALVFADTLDRTGFFGFEFECRRPGRVILAFDEIEGRPLDWWMNASVDFTAPGRYRFETFDPSVAKVFRIYTFEAEGDVRGMWVREYENPEPRQAVFHSSDPQLNAIFGAAVQSLAANTLDTLMDCPGRERGSWLCDSTFTGRASTFLCGPSVERTFFEDWALGDLAWSGEKGILPPIYPANTYSGFMIRNWPVWLVVHAADFVARTGEREFADKLKPRLMSFIDYLREKYVDRASGYPTFDGIVAYMEDDCRARGAFGTTQAMLWVAALEAVDRLYGRPDCAAEAKALREKVLRERWNGTWFAASEKGDDITEAVQDYAFFFGFATPESHPGLWKRYVDELGPARRIEGLSGRLWTHPQVRPADVFPVGLMRLETLSRFGETAACFRDLSAFFGGMAEKTGTLWEFRHVQGSLCHGYPSYLLPILWAEALGVKEIDLVNKTIRIASPENAPLAYAAAALPLSGGFLEVSWRRTANGIDFNFSAPDGFEVKTEGVTNTCPRNPVLDGWYADPQIRRYGETYWIFPTRSSGKEPAFDAFSSRDLRTWTKHERILTTNDVSWARTCLWAPDAHEVNGRYYLFFSANDAYPVSRKMEEGEPQKEPGLKGYGGIGVAVADRPEGPYRDLIGKPLVDRFWNGAQPIDQYVFAYKGEWYMVYGGWGRSNMVRLAPDFKSLVPFPDGKLWHPCTPPEYTEGSVMFERKGVWYYMYSGGQWTNGSYCIKYCTADSPFGPFTYRGCVLSSQEPIATGAGHHSVICLPNSDDWYVCYHRRPIPNLSVGHRVTCLDRMFFNEDGTIRPIVMTK